MTLTKADIPLGPLAGTELTLWCSKSGRLWHGDSECPALKQWARKAEQTQPSKGSLADLASPGEVHCAPPGPLAQHLVAAEALVKFDAHTDTLIQDLAQNKVDLTAFDLGTVRQAHPIIAKAPLAKVWKRCRERRELFLSDLSRRLEDRLPIMLAAAWARINEKPHSGIRNRKYDKFEDIAVHKFEPIEDLSEWDVRELTGRHVLPKYLDLVKKGEYHVSASDKVSAEQARWARRAVEKMPGDQPDEERSTHIGQIHDAWIKTTRQWISILEGICTAHDGMTFAVFHEGQLPVAPYVMHKLFPSARIRATDFTWLAGSIPAIFRLFLQQRNCGLVGLELEREEPYLFDGKRPALFLKNLFTLYGLPKIAKHVETVASDPPRRPPVDTSGTDDYFHGFGYGAHDSGLTPGQCNYALAMASRDRRIRKSWITEIDDEPDEPTVAVGGLPPEVVQLLEQGNSGDLLAKIQLYVRRDQLAAVRDAVQKPGGLESELQAALANAWWMFGGEFVEKSLRRRLVRTIELDIPLLRPDGVLHVVELKRADVQVARWHRNRPIVANAVHEGVGQAMNYLTLLDEQRTDLLNEFGIDTRRASATVVVGCRTSPEGPPPADIHETLRIFNSHLSRVEVITYQQLLERAERVLDLLGTPDGASAQSADAPSGE
ncbi:Shedu anti-phage system protein SduA domain-containing protein [Amycolatopsis sp. NPDC003676]